MCTHMFQNAPIIPEAKCKQEGPQDPPTGPRSVPALGNLLVLMLLFFYIFGLLGVSYFKGRYAFCAAPPAVPLGTPSLIVPQVKPAQGH